MIADLHLRITCLRIMSAGCQHHRFCCCRVQHVRQQYPGQGKTLYEPFSAKHVVTPYIRTTTPEGVEVENREVAVLAALGKCLAIFCGRVTVWHVKPGHMANTKSANPVQFELKDMVLSEIANPVAIFALIHLYAPSGYSGECVIRGQCKVQ